MQVDSLHWLIIAHILLLILMAHVRTQTVHEHLTECWGKCEEVVQGQKAITTLKFVNAVVAQAWTDDLFTQCRCMASSLVRTGFVRGSMTQGNGCYQHRCINNSLEVWFLTTWCSVFVFLNKSSSVIHFSVLPKLVPGQCLLAYSEFSWQMTCRSHPVF